ncbi:MAG: transposase [Candidatus Ancillula sp.]|nr:transposase [Candidatus Ancillula sp.]
MVKQKVYSDVFKRKVMDEILDENREISVQQIAKENEIPEGTIYNWVRKYKLANPEIKIKTNGWNKQGGRPKGKNLMECKYESITLRISRDERDILERRSILAGESLSKYIRTRVLEKPIMTPKKLQDEDVLNLKKFIKVVSELQVEIAKIGGNINDTVRWMNYLPTRVKHWDSVEFEKIIDVASGQWLGIKATNHENGESWSSESLIHEMDKLQKYAKGLREIRAKSERLIDMILEKNS